MKTRMKLIMLLVIVFSRIAVGCGSSPSVSAPNKPVATAPDKSTVTTPDKPTDPDSIDLDAAIREASDYLNNNVPGGSMVVFLNVQSVSEALSDYVIDGLTANAVKDRVFTAVDRQQLDLIRTEQDFQLSGWVDEKRAVSIGKILGAQTIVSGSIRKLGDYYRMTIRALDVETAQVQGQYNRNAITGKRIAELMENNSGGKEIKNSLAAVKAANEGDYIIMKSGERYVLTYDEIEIARGNINLKDFTSAQTPSHSVKLYPDNRSAHLFKTSISFTLFMQLVERYLYPGQYIDNSGNYHDFEPVRSPQFPVFYATVRIQTYSDGESSVEQWLITAYNYSYSYYGKNYIRRYFSTDRGWIWGYVTSSYRPIGEARQIEFDKE